MAAPPPYCSGLGERVSANQGGLWRRAAYCPLDTIYHAVVIGRVGSVRQCIDRPCRKCAFACMPHQCPISRTLKHFSDRQSQRQAASSTVYTKEQVAKERRVLR